MASQKCSIFLSCKMPQFSKKPPLSGAEKHPDFQVTCWRHFDTTNAKFNDWWKH